MRLLLDTHVLLWWLAGEPLSASAHEAIADPLSEVWLSAGSVWEMSIKAGLGRLTMPTGLARVLASQGIEVLDVTLPHALEVGSLPPLHRDPFDRLLVAQARVQGLVLVTRDETIIRYDVPSLVA